MSIPPPPSCCNSNSVGVSFLWAIVHNYSGIYDSSICRYFTNSIMWKNKNGISTFWTCLFISLCHDTKCFTKFRVSNIFHCRVILECSILFDSFTCGGVYHQHTEMFNICIIIITPMRISATCGYKFPWHPFLLPLSKINSCGYLVAYLCVITRGRD